MLRPHTVKKLVTMTEEEWLAIYRAAQVQGIDPVHFIKNAAASAVEKLKSVLNRTPRNVL